nr:uncharacterized protein KIAA0930 homolog isoform X3 [Danaus plexippus plexippus]
MALGGSTFLQNATMLEQLLEEINFQRTKEMRQLMKDDSGFVVLQGTTYWTDLFVRHFLFQEEQSIDCDDLLFFVRKRHVKGSSRYLPKYETDVEVFRKDSKKLPIGDPEIDWEETVYLNLIVHQFDYTLTLAICTRTSPKELQVLKRHSQKVYASPSRRKMDTKGEGEEMTYPHICFMVDNFDEVFCDIVVRDGEMVCVELVARGRGGAAQAVIFLGSIRYDALTRVYDARQSSLSTKVAQRMSFGLLGRGAGAAARCEFVRMKGPGGKGHAEVAVSRARSSGVHTPCSEPGLGPELWDSDFEDDPDELFLYRHQRRLSDPSANLNHFVRGGWRARDKDDTSRSENEGLDALADGLAEVEAGDLRDGNDIIINTPLASIWPVDVSLCVVCSIPCKADMFRLHEFLYVASSRRYSFICHVTCTLIVFYSTHAFFVVLFRTVLLLLRCSCSCRPSPLTGGSPQPRPAPARPDSYTT